MARCLVIIRPPRNYREWGNRAGDLLPSSYLTVELYFLEETKRRVVLQPQGERFLKVLAEFKQATFAR